MANYGLSVADYIYVVVNISGLHRQAEGDGSASPDGEIFKGTGDPVYRRSPNNEVQAYQPSELCVQVSTSRPIFTYVCSVNVHAIMMVKSEFNSVGTGLRI